MDKFLLIFLLSVAKALGFFYQVGVISNRYLKYQTRTFINLITPSLFSIPSVSTCFRINDVLKYNEVREICHLSGIRHFSGKIMWDDYYRDTYNFTVEDWFNFTPNPIDVFGPEDACYVRRPDKFAPEWFDQDTCQSIFKITKYFDRKYVCYRAVHIFAKKNLDVIVSPGVICEIFFNEYSFKSLEYVSVLVNSKDSSHFYDTVFASNQKISTKTFSKLKVNYRSIKQTRLHSPYDTKCVEIQSG